ncbi:MAG: hypothetical protein H7301_02370 [Cryobacterium sp.]|nr:hypothetical protein [Oligoflexia bacterium]
MIKRGAIAFALLPVTLYAVYFLSVIVFLNTPLFTGVTGMRDPENTQVLFSRAWSPWPDTLYVGKITVAIRDASVTSKLTFSHVKIRFDTRALFHREALLHSVEVENTEAFIHFKDESESLKFREKFETAEDKIEVTDEEISERKKTRFKINVEDIALPQVSLIQFDNDRITGDIGIRGKFFLQPGAEAEIGPATLKISQGKWNEDLKKISFESKIHFDRFIPARTKGDEVYRHLSADASGTAQAETLRILNVTLRSLGEYGFGTGNTALKTELHVRSGRLLPGSFLESEPTAIHFESPRIQVGGQGQVSWKVAEKGDFSTLKVHASSAKTKIQVSERMKVEGAVEEVKAEATLSSLFIPTAFSGLTASLKVQNGQFQCVTNSTEPWRVKIRIGGELQVLAGTRTSKLPKKPPSNFQIDIIDSSVKLKEFGKVDGRGRLNFSVDPIDFQAGRSNFPAVSLVYAVRLENQYNFVIQAKNQNLYRLFGQNKKESDLWNGDTKIEVNGFDEILRYLHDTDRLSGLVKSLFSSKILTAAVEWQAASDSLWIRMKSLKTDRSLSIFGTYVQDDKKAATGVFEGKVIGIPVGIGLSGEDVKFRVLPKQSWYDELKQPGDKKAAPK